MQSHPRFINRVNGALFEPVSQFPAVDKTVCLKIIQQSLQLSIKSSCREWSDYYYLAKVQRKLDKPAGWLWKQWLQRVGVKQTCGQYY